MASDPRERIEAGPLCVRWNEDEQYYEIGSNGIAGESGWGTWPDLVAFAKAILAANNEWLGSQAQTATEGSERDPIE